MYWPGYYPDKSIISSSIFLILKNVIFSISTFISLDTSLWIYHGSLPSGFTLAAYLWIYPGSLPSGFTLAGLTLAISLLGLPWQPEDGWDTSSPCGPPINLREIGPMTSRINWWTVLLTANCPQEIASVQTDIQYILHNAICSRKSRLCKQTDKLHNANCSRKSRLCNRQMYCTIGS